MIRRASAAVLLPLALAACGSGADNQNVDALDNEITANTADPALMGALQDQIMVDPQLASQSNKDAIRPPSQPYSSPLPAETVAAAKAAMPKEGELLKAPAPSGKCEACAAQDQAITLASLTAKQKDKRTAGCASKLNYSAAWAARLPAGMPLHPQARVSEAAGAQDAQCALRVVSFSTPQPLQTMIDWYYTKAVKSGFSAEHQARNGQHVLGGIRRQDGSAYVVFLSSRGDGGTDLDLVANGGN